MIIQYDEMCYSATPNLYSLSSVLVDIFSRFKCEILMWHRGELIGLELELSVVVQINQGKRN